VIPETIAVFLRTSVKTTWALDLLLLMKQTPERVWTLGELTTHMRSSKVIIEDALKTFMNLKLIAEDQAGFYRYTSTNAELEPVVTELVRLYNERPLAIIREIVSAPNDKIQSFVDAFRLKKD